MSSKVKEVQALLLCDMTPLEDMLIDDLEGILRASLPADSYFESCDVRANHDWSALPWIEIVFAFASTTIATSVLTKFGDDIYAFIKKELTSLSSKTRRKKQLILAEIKRLESRKAGERKFEFQDDAYYQRIDDDIRALSKIEEEIDNLDKIEEVDDVSLSLLNPRKACTITINAHDVLLQGRFESQSDEEFFEVIGKAQELFLEAKKMMESEREKLLQSPLYRVESSGAKQTPAFQSGLWLEYGYDREKKKWELVSITQYKPDSKTGGYMFVEGEPHRIYFSHDISKREKK